MKYSNQTYNLISFLLKKKNNFYWNISNWKKIILDTIISIIFIGNGIVLGCLGNNISIENERKLDLFVFFFALLYPVLSRIFTGISKSKTYFFNYYPIKRTKAATIDLIVNFICNTNTWIVFSFLFSYLILRRLGGGVLYFQAILIWLLSYLFNENFGSFIQTRTRLKYLILNFFVVLIVFYLLDRYLYNVFADLIILICWIILTIVLFIFNYNLINENTNSIVLKINIGNSTIKSVFRNGNVWIALILAISFKSIFLIIYFHFGKKIPEFVSMLFLTPIIYFTNFLNNVWGWLYGHILNYVIRGASFKTVLLNYVLISLPIILIDIFLQFGLTFIFDQLSIHTIEMYSYSLVFMLIVGFVGSLICYRRVINTISFSNPYTTNIVVNLISFFPCIIYAGRYLNIGNTQVYYVIFLILVESGMCWVYSRFSKIMTNLKSKLLV